MNWLLQTSTFVHFLHLISTLQSCEAKSLISTLLPHFGEAPVMYYHWFFPLLVWKMIRMATRYFQFC